jgi:hypothetical protein
MPLIDEGALASLVRDIVRRETARPEFTHQRNVEAITGLPPRDYLRLCRAGAWPSTKERRLVISRTADVIAYVEQRIALRDEQPANVENGSRMAAAGWRRVSQ